MSSNIEIGGKVYTAKRCNVQTLLKDQKIGEKMMKAVEKDDWTLHTKLSLERAGLFLEGDVSGLSPEILTPVEGLALVDFFSSCLAEGMPVSDSTSKTLSSSINQTQEPDSPKDMI